MQVRKATDADVTALSQSLARAFYDDPVISWMIPDDAKRLRLGPFGFETWLGKIYMPKAEVYTDETRKVGALWAPPGKWRMSVGLQARLAPRMFRLFGVRRMPTILKGLATLDKAHPDAQPHYYLGILGTDPDHQGKGLGGAAMQPVLDRCDTDDSGKLKGPSVIARYQTRVFASPPTFAPVAATARHNDQKTPRITNTKRMRE